MHSGAFWGLIILGSIYRDISGNLRFIYITYMKERGHSHLTVIQCGLFISTENAWLAASPDGIVEDCTNGSSRTSGLLDIKNPYSARKMTLLEAVEKSTFCLEKDKDSGTYTLKKKHDYFYQIQCQLYCTNKDCCDLVVNTEREIHVERIYNKLPGGPQS